MMQLFRRCALFFALALTTVGANQSYAIALLDSTTTRVIDREVRRLMDKGEIPGLSLVIVQGNRTFIKSFGFADLAHKHRVTANTLFEAGSCTKAFTALALLQLQQQGRVDLDSPVKRYLPWLSTLYKDSVVDVTLRQLMHHTSGLPTSALSLIPEGNGRDALKNTVQTFAGIQLNHLPGDQFEYSSVNYDVLGLVIQERTGQPFESYLKHKLLLPLGMTHSSIGYVEAKKNMAQGYKIGYFEPRAYDPPLFRGNNAAGYLITDAHDLATWLKFQLGVLKTGTNLDGLRVQSWERDATVPVNRAALSSYAAGWEVFLDGRGTVAHGGLNPSFSAYVGFIPGRQLGLGILTNANSDYTGVISANILKILLQEKITVDPPANRLDRDLSAATFGLTVYVLAVIVYLLYKACVVWRGTQTYQPLSKRAVLKIASLLAPLGLLLMGIYLLPDTLVGFTWEATLVWAPISFVGMTGALVLAMLITYVAYIVNSVLPDGDKYANAAPKIIVLGLLSGLANAAVILLIMYAVSHADADGNNDKTGSVFFYFSIAFLTYILGRKVVQTKLIHLTINLIYDTRIKLLNKLFASTYQDFEQMERGKIYATLNNDTDMVGETANIIVTLVTSVVTALAVFVYLMAISFEASAVTVLVITLISCLYYLVVKRSRALFEVVRNTANQYLFLLNGLIDGFKELSIHASTRWGYRRDLEAVSQEFRDKLISTRISLVNAFLAGESMLIALLALVAFCFPILFPDLGSGTILSYIIVMLYLIGPVNAILASIPVVIQIRVAWKRIQHFMQEIQVDTQPAGLLAHQESPVKEAHVLTVEGLKYRYKGGAGEKGFEFGPIEFELRKGEAIFITGENGSGKTTLSRLLTGLYNYTEGRISIDGEQIESRHLGEYFSIVFSPFYLFKKIYNFNAAESKDKIDAYLRMLGLCGKVTIVDNAYSTIDLSQGQKKRLALLQCYLEDRPIYLLDEWAADQDPEYRRFFYRTLLPEMKRKGKMIIVISHDDQYFAQADQIIKLSEGKQQLVSLKEEGIR